MPIPKISNRMALAMRTNPGIPVVVKISGEGNVKRFRAVEQFIRATDLVRLSGGAVGEHTAIETRKEFDKLGGMNDQEVVGGPVRTVDSSRYDAWYE